MSCLPRNIHPSLDSLTLREKKAGGRREKEKKRFLTSLYVTFCSRPFFTRPNSRNPPGLTFFCLKPYGYARDERKLINMSTEFAFSLFRPNGSHFVEFYPKNVSFSSFLADQIVFNDTLLKQSLFMTASNVDCDLSRSRRSGLVKYARTRETRVTRDWGYVLFWFEVRV